MKAAKIALGFACGLVLSACNMVVSSEPWLATSVDAPVMKPGLWAMLEDEDCEVDADLALEFWPDCAEATVISDDGSWYSQKEDSDEWEMITPVLEYDDPVIGQIELPKEIAAKEGGEALFLYFALQPERYDSQGKISAMRYWLVQCGPLSTSGRSGFRSTDAPFDGLTVREDNCEAESIEALRNAAALSLDLPDGSKPARWISKTGAWFRGGTPAGGASGFEEP